MADQGERRLAAILSADVAGYSKLMGDDERATVLTLTDYREVFGDHIARHKGRLVDSPGDNLLAEFASPVEALNAAVDIQHDLASRNRQLAEHRQMHFRIGLNLGDVIAKDDGTVYGDGVNIAARLEGMAEPGGICLSETVFFQVEGKVNAAFEDIGAHEVKNIAKPVRTYRVVGDAATLAANRPSKVRTRSIVIPAAAVALVVAGLAVWQYTQSSDQAAIDENTVLAPPTGPSIAVLPFVNMSGDPEQEYFSDGFTDTLITDLSNIRDLFVIARNSSFTYKGMAVDVRQVGRELGVRFVLEGGVQLIMDNVRINVQLVDARTGDHVWAERYDREFSGIFALQDEIAQKILTELEITLVTGEMARSWRRSTENPDAYKFFLRGWEARMRSTMEDSARARALFQQALELDPDFTAARYGLGYTHFADGYSGWSQPASESFERAISLAKQAIALDPNFGGSYELLGEVLVQYKGEHEQGLEYMRQAVALEPNSSRYNWHVGDYLCPFGRAEEGLEYIHRAYRLSPHPPAMFYEGYAICYLMLGRFEESIAAGRRTIAGAPDFIWPHIELTLAYMELGRMDEARAQAKEVVRINPRFAVEDNVFITTLSNPETRKRFKKLLRQAGLP
jgi:adenylate cyclase